MSTDSNELGAPVADGRCDCRCGYRCPVRPCPLSAWDCVAAHYKIDCDHKWDGPWHEEVTEEGGTMGAVTCSKCKMLCVDHDLGVGP